jgi:hypothetical protein
MLETTKLIGLLLLGLALIYGIITVGLMAFQSAHFMIFFVAVIVPTLILYRGCRRISRGERVHGAILLFVGAAYALAIYALRFVPLPP